MESMSSFAGEESERKEMVMLSVSGVPMATFRCIGWYDSTASE